MKKSQEAITRETRIIAGAISFILLFAFIVLYLTPERTGTDFAWEIKPPMTALVMGAGYLGGAYFFLIAAFAKKWHFIKTGFPAVWIFTIYMFVATLLHLDKFNRNFAFYGWFILYMITPFLLPWLWWRNRDSDDGSTAEQDVVVPDAFRLILKIAGIVFSLVALGGFLLPNLMIGIWPWTLTPLTTRVLCGWFSLVAVGSYLISNERRWSGWRSIFISIAIWTALVLIGSFLHPADFNTGPINWLTLGLAAQLIGMVGLYITMEAKLRET